AAHGFPREPLEKSSTRAPCSRLPAGPPDADGVDGVRSRAAQLCRGCAQLIGGTLHFELGGHNAAAPRIRSDADIRAPRRRIDRRTLPMLRSLTTRALVLALAMTAAPTARGADQTILGSQLVVKNPSTPEKRKVVAKAKEVGSPDTIVGNPAAGGATLSIAANGGTPSAQTFALPMGTSALTGRPFWTGDAVRGFKYKDAKGENGPVKAAQLK